MENEECEILSQFISVHQRINCVRLFPIEGKKNLEKQYVNAHYVIASQISTQMSEFAAN